MVNILLIDPRGDPQRGNLLARPDRDWRYGRSTYRGGVHRRCTVLRGRMPRDTRPGWTGGQQAGRDGPAVNRPRRLHTAGRRTHRPGERFRVALLRCRRRSGTEITFSQAWQRRGIRLYPLRLLDFFAFSFAFSIVMQLSDVVALHSNSLLVPAHPASNKAPPSDMINVTVFIIYFLSKVIYLFRPVTRRKYHVNLSAN